MKPDFQAFQMQTPFLTKHIGTQQEKKVAILERHLTLKLLRDLDFQKPVIIDVNQVVMRRPLHDFVILAT